MIKDYKDSWVEEIEEYNLLFYTDRSGGLSFPCDKDGNILPLEYDQAKKNYEYAMNHPEHYPYAWKVVKKHVRRYRNPASGICNCGERIDLRNEYLGACECPNCGQWWNMFGQELNNPETWRDGDDW